MTLLLDTHTLLWFLRDDPLLSSTAKSLIQDPANEKLVSIATCWEISIKAGLGKMGLTEPAAVLLARELPRNNFVLLDIKLGAGITCIEFLRKARAAKASAQIVVVSAVDDENMVEMAKGLGAVDYVPKPFSVATLDKVVLSRLKPAGPGSA